MITVKNQETKIVILDATKLPKYYKINLGQYSIDFYDESNILVTLPTSKTKSSDITKIINLICELSYAAKGFKDCEMQSAKYNRIMSCFSYKNIQIKDFK